MRLTAIMPHPNVSKRNIASQRETHSTNPPAWYAIAVLHQYAPMCFILKGLTDRTGTRPSGGFSALKVTAGVKEKLSCRILKRPCAT